LKIDIVEEKLLCLVLDDRLAYISPRRQGGDRVKLSSSL
jgi:hypothetical protein